MSHVHPKSDLETSKDVSAPIRARERPAYSVPSPLPAPLGVSGAWGGEDGARARRLRWWAPSIARRGLRPAESGSAALVPRSGQLGGRSRSSAGAVPYAYFGGGLSWVKIDRWVQIEVVPVRWAEPSAPAAAETLPDNTDRRPYRGRGEGGWRVPHTQISRQRRAPEVEALRCRR